MTRTGMESYIVRVYRRDDEDPAKIHGMVEVVQTGMTEKFANRDELCGVICRKPKGRKKKSDQEKLILVQKKKRN